MRVGRYVCAVFFFKLLLLLSLSESFLLYLIERFSLQRRRSIHVSLHLAELTQSVNNGIMRVLASALTIITATLTKAVNPNAFLARIARQTKLAYATSARILVQACAAFVRSARLSITSLRALASPDTSEILSQSAPSSRKWRPNRPFAIHARRHPADRTACVARWIIKPCARVTSPSRVPRRIASRNASWTQSVRRTEHATSTHARIRAQALAAWKPIVALSITIRSAVVHKEKQAIPSPDVSLNLVIV